MAKIAWLLPALFEGSGGHRTILQNADLLEKAGHDCVIYTEGYQYFSNQAAKKHINKLFGYDFKNVEIGWNNITPADLVFATIWYSAKVVRDLKFPCVKAYFVQDYEPLFHPVGDAFIMAENSYRYGLQLITIGRWLSAKLKHDFDVNASYFDFCADMKAYRRLTNIKNELAVCFIYQPEKSRRCSQIGIEALCIVKRCLPEVKIYLYGSKGKSNVWFNHDNLGLITVEECNRLYNRCSVGLCISSSNPSRIPFEMMASGLPVIEVYRENNLYDFPQDAVKLCEPTPESIAAGIFEVLSDSVLAKRMRQAGMQYMADCPLERGYDQFLSIVDRLLNARTLEGVVNEQMYRLPPVTSAEFEKIPLKVGCVPNPVAAGPLAFLSPEARQFLNRCFWTFKRLLS